MFTKTQLATSALLVSSLFCASSQAKELSLKEYASFMIAQTAQATVNEIKLAVQTDILNAAHSFELVPSNIKTSITITDIASNQVDDSNLENEEEKSE